METLEEKIAGILTRNYERIRPKKFEELTNKYFTDANNIPNIDLVVSYSEIIKQSNNLIGMINTSENRQNDIDKTIAQTTENLSRLKKNGNFKESEEYKTLEKDATFLIDETKKLNQPQKYKKDRKAPIKILVYDIVAKDEKGNHTSYIGFFIHSKYAVNKKLKRPVELILENSSTGVVEALSKGDIDIAIVDLQTIKTNSKNISGDISEQYITSDFDVIGYMRKNIPDRSITVLRPLYSGEQTSVKLVVYDMLLSKLEDTIDKSEVTVIKRNDYTQAQTELKAYLDKLINEA